MPDDKAFSIRTPLQGELVDFIRSSGFDCPYTDLLIRDAVCLLGSYREEDIPLFPDFFVLPNTETVSSLAPGTERVAVGRIRLEEGTAAAVLKDCAGLAVQGWAIYVSRVQEKPPLAEYGLFRARKHSLAVTAGIRKRTT